MKAISANPGCPAGVYVALGVCCFHLGIYEGASWACQVTLQIDVSMLVPMLLLLVENKLQCSCFAGFNRRCEGDWRRK